LISQFQLENCSISILFYQMDYFRRFLIWQQFAGSQSEAADFAQGFASGGLQSERSHQAR
jgi:hypothetical protein